MAEFNCSAFQKQLDYSNERIVSSIILYVILMVIPLFFIATFFYGKYILRFERFRVRRSALVYVAVFTCLFHAQAGPGSAVFGSSFPCWLRSFFTMLVVPLACANMLGKMLTFYFLNKLSVELAGTKLDEILDVNHHRSWPERMFRGLFEVLRYILALVWPGAISKLTKSEAIQGLTFVASAKGTLVLFGLLFAPFLIATFFIIIASPPHMNGCTGCALLREETYEIIVCVSLFFGFMVLSIFRARHYSDPWNLRREVLLSLFFCMVAFFGFILGVFVDPGPEAPVDYQIMIIAGFLSFLGSQTIYQLKLAYKNERASMNHRAALSKKRGGRKKNTRQVGSVGPIESTHQSIQPASSNHKKATLKIIMENDTLAQLFESFLVTELGVESLSFLRDIELWEKRYHDVAASARVARAKRLYHIYISSSGKCPINIPSQVMSEIKVKLMKEGIEDVDRTLFENAKQEIQDLLTAGAVLRFQNTKEFMDYANQHEI